MIAILVILVLIYYYRNKAVGMPFHPHASTPVGAYFIPFFGHLWIILKNYKRMYDFSYDMYLRQGSTTYAFLLPFSPPFIQTHDPKNVEFILKTKFNSFVKGKYIRDRLQDVLGRGIFVVDGHDWYFQRKMASNIFTIKLFRDYVGQVFTEKMNRLTSIIREATGPIDVHDMFYKFTLDVFGNIGFGTDLDCLTRDIPFGKSLERCQSQMSYRFYSSTWKIEEMLFYRQRKQLLEDVKILREFAEDLIRKRRSEGEISANVKSDLLTLFMKTKDAEGKPFSDDLLCDFMLNLLIAGRDTTAQALSWSI